MTYIIIGVLVLLVFSFIYSCVLLKVAEICCKVGDSQNIRGVNTSLSNTDIVWKAIVYITIIVFVSMILLALPIIMYLY